MTARKDYVCDNCGKAAEGPPEGWHEHRYRESSALWTRERHFCSWACVRSYSVDSRSELMETVADALMRAGASHDDAARLIVDALFPEATP